MKTVVKSSAAIAIAILVFAGCKTAPPRDPAAIELFNGNNLDGWTFCMKNDSDPAKTWSVSDGVMHCTGQPYGYARTMQTYQNYKLTCIWRFVRVAPHADNSGIFVHIQPPDKVWPACVECQGQFHHQGDLILQGGASADGYPANGNKAVFIRQIGPHNENPAGEWGTNTIVCKGGNIDLSINGKLMNHMTGCTLTSGYVGIQAEGGDMEIRKLTLEPLE